jgi:hypothetical protein
VASEAELVREAQTSRMWERELAQLFPTYKIKPGMKTTRRVRPGLREAVGKLPKGWEKRKTQEGRVYFVDHNTGRLRGLGLTLLEAVGTLPEGWEARQTCDGNLYFVNHITKSTLWIHPPQKMR